MTLPVLAICTAGVPAEELLPLLGRLARWCRPCLLDLVSDRPAAGPDRPVAVLAGDPRAAVPEGVPLAVLVRCAADLDVGCAPAAVRVLTDDEAVLAAAGVRGVWLPAGALPSGVRQVPPWVRARVRRARGLPEQPLLVLRGGVPYWQADGDPGAEVAGPLLATALAAAAAAALTGPTLPVLALAWGTPLVTDAQTGAALGADDGREVLVVDGDEHARAAAARQLAGDPQRAAALSWAGRLLAERRHDLAGTAAALARVLLPASPARRGHLALDALDTPAGARVRARHDDALAALLAEGPAEGRPDRTRRTP